MTFPTRSSTSPSGASETTKPRIWPPIVVLAVGTVVGITAFVVFLVSFISAVEGSRVFTAPVTIEMHCTVGEYYVYQRVFTDGFTRSPSLSTVLNASDVTVTAPDGTSVQTATVTTDTTVSNNTGRFRSYVSFHAHSAGDYRIHIGRVTPPQVLAGPAIGTAFVDAASWFLLLAVGMLAGLAGLIWLIVVGVRRSRLRAAAAPVGVGYPGQWYGPGPTGFPYGQPPSAPVPLGPPPTAPPPPVPTQGPPGAPPGPPGTR